MKVPTINPRRPYDDQQPDGYLECFRDYAENNREAVEWFLENRDEIESQIQGKTSNPAVKNSGSQTGLKRLK